jgi:hypothetical protein
MIYSGNPQVQPPSLAQAALVRRRLPLPDPRLDLLLAFLQPQRACWKWKLRGHSIDLRLTPWQSGRQWGDGDEALKNNGVGCWIDEVIEHWAWDCEWASVMTGIHACMRA